MCPSSPYVTNPRRAKLRSVPIRTDLCCPFNAVGWNQPNVHPADCFLTDVTPPFSYFPLLLVFSFRATPKTNKQCFGYAIQFSPSIITRWDYQFSIPFGCVFQVKKESSVTIIHLCKALLEFRST